MDDLTGVLIAVLQGNRSTFRSVVHPSIAMTIGFSIPVLLRYLAP